MVDVEDPVASVYVLNEDHVAILVATTAREHERTGRFAAGEEVVFSFSFENVLAPGRYTPLFTLAHRGTGLDLMDRFEGVLLLRRHRAPRDGRARRPSRRGRRRARCGRGECQRSRGPLPAGGA